MSVAHEHSCTVGQAMLCLHCTKQHYVGNTQLVSGIERLAESPSLMSAMLMYSQG